MRAYPRALIPAYPAAQTLRVVPGPQDDHFTRRGLETFLTGEYTVAPDSDRMGVRLLGPPPEHSRGADIISDGLPLGTVQVPGHGQPIVMLADRLTTGHYPKITTVITTDIPKIAQLKPGEKVRFRSVTMAEAVQALQELEDGVLQVYSVFEVAVKGRRFHVLVRRAD